MHCAPRGVRTPRCSIPCLSSHADRNDCLDTAVLGSTFAEAASLCPWDLTPNLAGPHPRLCKSDQFAGAGSSGTRSEKWAPLGDDVRVSSAPNCVASALTSRVPSRLLVVGSKLAGTPTPSS